MCTWKCSSHDCMPLVPVLYGVYEFLLGIDLTLAFLLARSLVELVVSSESFITSKGARDLEMLQP